MIRQREKLKVSFLLLFSFCLYSSPSFPDEAIGTSTGGLGNQIQGLNARQTQLNQSIADTEKKLKEATDKDEKEKLERKLAELNQQKTANEAAIKSLQDRINALSAQDKPSSGGGEKGGGGGEKGGGEEKKSPPPPPPPPPAESKGGDKKEEPKPPEAAKAPPPPENQLDKIQPPKEDKALTQMLADLKKANEKKAEKTVVPSESNPNSQIADLTAQGNKATADIIAANEAAFKKTAAQNATASQAKQNSGGPKTVAQRIQETALAGKRSPAGVASGTTRANEMPAVGILPSDTEDSSGLTPLAKQLSLRNQRAVFKAPPAVSVSSDIIPSLYDLCSSSPGCMKK